MPRRRLTSPQFGETAFTLLEVLVVVALIALLIAILFPPLVMARDRARGVQCLGNLDQQGVAAFMYAYERGGALPSAIAQVETPPEAADALATIPRETARVLNRMVSRASTVFYCPAAGAQPYRPANFEASVASPPNSPLDAQILYWWLANPTGKTAARFLDVDSDGSISDEYIRRIEARRISDVAISTDQSRQERPPSPIQDGYGWYFVHGNQGTQYNTVDTKGLAAWKNNLYGDGHAAAVRAPAVIPRWGENRAGW